MLGTIVNAGAIVLGCAVGLLLRRGIPKRVTDAVMKGIGLCVIYIGISGALEGEKTIAMIIAMAAGGAIGTALDLNGGMERLGRLLEEKLARGGSGLSAGFVTASLIYCVGARRWWAPESGLTGSHDMLFTKSLLDGISAIVLTASLGIGVGLSAVSVFVYQGAITLLAGLLAPVLTDAVVAEMTCVGSMLIFALGLNMIGVTKIKVMDFVPAIFLVIPLCYVL